jgi:hypothetical protein
VLRAFVLLAALLFALPVQAQQDNAASEPSDVSVTIYRAPYRNGGSIVLADLGGFAVVQETRTVRIPAGRSRLRFEGVVDGIIPESAIVTGLPGGVIEKNRDADLLSTSSLMRAVRGKSVSLKRTDPATGKVMLVPGEIIAASEDGVTFRTAGGVESLRCSGLPETFRYTRGADGLSARPTLSVLTRSSKEITATVTLTYIAEGFDWSANYTAQINPDGKTMDIGGWITLANGNSVSLANARTQIVAGGLNRSYVQRFFNNQPQVVARCWPAQRTHEIPLRPDQPYHLVQPYRPGDYRLYKGTNMDADGVIVVTAQRREANLQSSPMAVSAISAAPPPPEQLGDLKLYRVPQRTTVAAQQMKQTRLIEQHGVPFERFHTASFPAVWYGSGEYRQQSQVILRTRNDKVHQLGLPLPSGAFVIVQGQFGRPMLIAEPDLRDTAEDEKIELNAGASSDVNVVYRTLRREGKKNWLEIEITNATPGPIDFELKLETYDNQRIVEADAHWKKRDGQPLFGFAIPANGSRKLLVTVEFD